MSNTILKIRSLFLKLFRRSDYKRWSSPEAFSPDWDPRTKRMAQLVPSGSRVIEFGAGRRQLELYLAASCKYFPSDLLERGQGTIICDLNTKPLPDLRSLELDGAVFSGVLEYIADLPAVIQWLSNQVSWCVASYACARSKPVTITRIREVWGRAENGWVNTYTEMELTDLFEQAGFVCGRQDRWQSQKIFVFQRTAAHAQTHSAQGFDSPDSNTVRGE